MESHIVALDTSPHGPDYPRRDGARSCTGWVQRDSGSQTGSGRAEHGSERLYYTGLYGCWLNCTARGHSSAWTAGSRGNCCSCIEPKLRYREGRDTFLVAVISDGEGGEAGSERREGEKNDFFRKRSTRIKFPVSNSPAAEIVKFP